eukprot:230589_1
MSTTATILGVVCLVVSFSYGFTLIHYGQLFWMRKDEMLIKKRVPTLVIIIYINAIILLCSGFPLTIVLYWHWDWSSNMSPSFLFSLDILNDLLVTPFFYTAAYFIALRYWLIYYNIQHLSSSSNLEWKKYITSSMKSLRTELWFIEHMKTIGNPSFMMKRVGVLVAIASCMEIALSLLYSPFNLIHSNIYAFLNLTIFLIPIVFVIVMWSKIPLMEDNIGLYKEFKFVAYWWSSIVFMYIICIFQIAFFGEHIATLFFGYLAVLSAVFAVPFRSTFWALRQIADTTPSLDMVHSNCDTKLSLHHILKDHELFHLYMQHLIREFSMECLLAFVEFTQYKVRALEVFKLKDVGHTFCITFPKSVPRSDIVYNDDAFKIKCHKLYLKYIEDTAEFEINIGWQDRLKLTQLMGDRDRWMSSNVTQMELFQMFDEPMKEMYKLMDYAKIRFAECIKVHRLQLSSSLSFV